jgi:hypothetical protein
MIQDPEGVFNTGLSGFQGAEQQFFGPFDFSNGLPTVVQKGLYQWLLGQASSTVQCFGNMDFSNSQDVLAFLNLAYAPNGGNSTHTMTEFQDVYTDLRNEFKGDNLKSQIIQILKTEANRRVDDHRPQP